MTKQPRSVREALVAELLGDVDELLTRAEAIPVALADAEKGMRESAAALDAAGDRYKMVVTAFTEQAKADLAEYLDRKTVEAATLATRDVGAAMQEAARLAFRSEASDKATALGISLGEAAKQFHRSTWSRVMEHGVTAILASFLTVLLTHWLFKVG